ncbi:MAG: DUF2059 domain-containing protein [Rhizobiaceae bacterium]|nr:DUF2059 domain-containing protein [Rhizobiaceae bacterium]
MTRVSRFRRLTIALAASAMVAASFPAFAQDASADISEDHLKAARAAVNAINATDIYDSILPEAAASLKSTLIQKNPDLQDAIIKTVDDEALKLAARRTDLEREAATIYAKVFSVDELNAIATFYDSAAGKKLITEGPIIVRDLTTAAEIWQRGIARDLAAEVGKVLMASNPTAGQGAPIDGQETAPAQAN